jgi:hypothetical protein
VEGEFLEVLQDEHDIVISFLVIGQQVEEGFFRFAALRMSGSVGKLLQCGESSTGSEVSSVRVLVERGQFSL